MIKSNLNSFFAALLFLILSCGGTVADERTVCIDAENLKTRLFDVSAAYFTAKETAIAGGYQVKKNCADAEIAISVGGSGVAFNQAYTMHIYWIVRKPGGALLHNHFWAENYEEAKTKLRDQIAYGLDYSP